jgi:hypothetical protein
MNTPTTSSVATSRRALAGDTRGVATIEYVTVFTFIGLVTALALWRLAPGVVQAYSQQRQALYLESP